MTTFILPDVSEKKLPILLSPLTHIQTLCATFIFFKKKLKTTFDLSSSRVKETINFHSGVSSRIRANGLPNPILFFSSRHHEPSLLLRQICSRLMYFSSSSSSHVLRFASLSLPLSFYCAVLTKSRGPSNHRLLPSFSLLIEVRSSPFFSI